jgi:hypothetical protein
LNLDIGQPQLTALEEAQAAELRGRGDIRQKIQLQMVENAGKQIQALALLESIAKDKGLKVKTTQDIYGELLKSPSFQDPLATGGAGPFTQGFSEEDQQMLDWIQANPNDPKAPLYTLELLRKYNLIKQEQQQQ